MVVFAHISTLFGLHRFFLGEIFLGKFAGNKTCSTRSVTYTQSVLLFPDSVIRIYLGMICSPVTGIVFVLCLDPRCDDIFRRPSDFLSVGTYKPVCIFLCCVRTNVCVCVFLSCTVYAFFVLVFVIPTIFVCTNLVALFFVLFVPLCGWLRLCLTGNGTDARRAADRTVLEVRYQEPKRWIFLQWVAGASG